MKEQSADEMAESKENADAASGREADNTDGGGRGAGLPPLDYENGEKLDVCSSC